jgi:sulfite exporter TauE/SafE
MQGFLLGIANGATCIAYCAPALIPYLIGEGKNVRQTSGLLTKFLAGRLVGYLGFAVLAWYFSKALALLPANREFLQGTAYTILSILLFTYGINSKAPACLLHRLPSHLTERYPASLPWLLGFLTGLNLCPPFLLVFVEAASTNSLIQTLIYFFTFFLGTALYFLPVPLLGAYQNKQQLQTIGKLTAILISLYYLYSGLIMTLGGM